MPIRPELRHLYRGPEWTATRARILARAKNRCESCGKPMHTAVFTYTWKTRIAFGEGWRYHMVWASASSPAWRNQHGRKCSLRSVKGLPRKVWVKLTVAHVDNNPYNMDDSNLAALCTWCHLHADAPFHRETRCRRKDAARPLLEQIA